MMAVVGKLLVRHFKATNSIISHRGNKKGAVITAPFWLGSVELCGSNFVQSKRVLSKA